MPMKSGKANRYALFDGRVRSQGRYRARSLASDAGHDSLVNSRGADGQDLPLTTGSSSRYPVRFHLPNQHRRERVEPFAWFRRFLSQTVGSLHGVRAYGDKPVIRTNSQDLPDAPPLSVPTVSLCSLVVITLTTNQLG